MSAGREILHGELCIGVRKFLRPDADIVGGVIIPFMVALEDAEFVRQHQSDPFVLRDEEGSWVLKIVSVEPTGKEGVWVSARVGDRVTQRAPAPYEDRHRGTLLGAPLPGLAGLPEGDLPEGDAGATAPLGLPVIPRKK